MSDWEGMPTEELIKAAGSLLHSIDTSLETFGAMAGAINEPNVLAGFMAELRDIKARASNIYYDCEQTYTANAPKRAEIPSLGLVEVKTATNRKKWQHDELFRSVISRLADEPGIFYDEDGVRLPPAAMAANVVGRLREVLSPSWKVTGIRAMGLDETEFCQVDEGHKSVVLPPKVAA